MLDTCRYRIILLLLLYCCCCKSRHGRRTLHVLTTDIKPESSLNFGSLAWVILPNHPYKPQEADEEHKYLFCNVLVTILSCPWWTFFACSSKFTLLFLTKVKFLVPSKKHKAFNLRLLRRGGSNDFAGRILRHPRFSLHELIHSSLSHIHSSSVDCCLTAGVYIKTACLSTGKTWRKYYYDGDLATSPEGWYLYHWTEARWLFLPLVAWCWLAWWWLRDWCK